MAQLIVPLVKVAAGAFVSSKVSKALAPKPAPLPAAPVTPAEAKPLESEQKTEAATQTSANTANRTVFSVAKKAAGNRNAVSQTSTQLSGNSNKLG